jgi:hypothetical protein
MKDPVTKAMAANPPWWKSKIHPMNKVLAWPEVGKGTLKARTRKLI